MKHIDNRLKRFGPRGQRYTANPGTPFERWDAEKSKAAGTQAYVNVPNDSGNTPKPGKPVTGWVTNHLTGERYKKR